MQRVIHSLLWAAAILGAAWISTANGLSDGAAIAVVMGLSGAALASINGTRPCGGRSGCVR